MAKKEKVMVIVLEEFQDKFDHKTMYPTGTELEVDKERADNLVSRELAKIKKVETPKEPKETKEAETETAKTEAEKPEAEQEDDDKGTEK